MNTYWKHVATIYEGETLLLSGLNIWDFEWQMTNKTVNVKDPIYKQDFTFDLYKIITEDLEIEFVAGEFSNCVYGIYLNN